MNHSSELQTLLQSLTYNPHAQLKAYFVPYGGIYWEDELPEYKILLSLSDQEYLYPFLMLNVRRKLWAHESLSEEEQRQWKFAQEIYPNWPIFKRLHITEDEYQQQLACEESSNQFYEAMMNVPDEVSVEQAKEETEKHVNP